MNGQRLMSGAQSEGGCKGAHKERACKDSSVVETELCQGRCRHCMRPPTPVSASRWRPRSLLHILQHFSKLLTTAAILAQIESTPTGGVAANLCPPPKDTVQALQAMLTEQHTWRRLCSSRITATSLVEYEGASAQRCCRMVASSASGMSPTCSSRNLERNALDNACACMQCVEHLQYPPR